MQAVNIVVASRTSLLVSTGRTFHEMGGRWSKRSWFRGTLGDIVIGFRKHPFDIRSCLIFLQNVDSLEGRFLQNINAHAVCSAGTIDDGSPKQSQCALFTGLLLRESTTLFCDDGHGDSSISGESYARQTYFRNRPVDSWRKLTPLLDRNMRKSLVP
jgi:hypothetical protein